MTISAREIAKEILRNKDDYMITDNMVIRDIFNKILKQKKYFSVILKDSKSEFVSYVLNADFKNRQYNFDALHPASGNKLFSNSKGAYLLSALDGVDILIPVKTRKTISVSNSVEDEIYSTSPPRKIYQYQRRRNYRVSLDEDSPLNFRILLHDKVQVIANTNNISSGGIAIKVSKEQSFNVNDVYEKCKLFMDRTKVMTVDVKISFLDRTSSDDELILGLEFINLNKVTENIISKIVRSAERQNLRELSRSSNKADITVYA